MRPSPCLSLLVALCLPAWAARAQVALVDPITRAQGSPSDYVFDLLQDRAGFFWMATDAGLVRYDGRDFVTWTTAEGLPHNYTYALHELPDGRIVVGTFRGAALLDRGRLTPLQGSRGSVHAIAHDRFRRIYLSDETGIQVCEHGRCRMEAAGQPTPEASFVPTRDGRLLFLFLGNRVVTLRPSSSGVTHAQRRLPVQGGDMLLALSSEQTGIVQRPGGGLAVWDFSQNRIVARLPGVTPRSMLVLPEGGFLLGTENGEVWRVDKAGTARIAGGADLSGYAVQALMRDYEGHLWLGLFGGGARQLVERGLRLPPYNSLLNQPALRLSRDRQGTVWMTTRGQLLARTVEGRINVFDVRSLGLAEDHPGGGHYLSANTNLYLRRTGKPAVPLLMDGNWFSSLLLGPGDTLWLGTYGTGIRRVVGEREVARPATGGPPVVEALVNGAHGAMWALTRSEGAWRYAGGRWTNVWAGLPSAAVFSLLDEPDGTLWIGTDRGLVRRRGTRTRVFDAAGQLRGQRLHALFRTGADTLWAVADRQLYAVVGDSLRRFGRARLRPDEGVAIHAAVPVSEERRLLLGTSAGLIEVDLRGLEPPLPAPRVAFVGLPETTVPPRDTVRLAQGVRSVALAFAPLTFGSGSPGQLQHRIGRGPWSEPTPERTVALAGLADGWHVVEARAVNAEGRVSMQPVRVLLYVPPPWWQTWPARALGLVALVAMAAFVARYLSTRRLRARLRALETEQHVQRERDRISRDLHDHVGAQLTGVLAGLELLGGEAPGAGGLLAALRAEVRETMGALRTAIFTLQHPPASFDELGRLLDRYVRDQARFRTTPVLRCLVEGHLDRPLDPFEALHLFRIAQEGLQNAIRHAGASCVLVRLAGDGASLSLTVEDDGDFRAPDGTGHGLTAMQARASEIGACLTLEPGTSGTTVRVAWPGEIARTVDAAAGEAVVP